MEQYNKYFGINNLQMLWNHMQRLLEKIKDFLFLQNLFKYHNVVWYGLEQFLFFSIDFLVHILYYAEELLDKLLSKNTLYYHFSWLYLQIHSSEVFWKSVKDEEHLVWNMCI